MHCTWSNNWQRLFSVLFVLCLGCALQPSPNPNGNVEQSSANLQLHEDRPACICAESRGQEVKRGWIEVNSFCLPVANLPTETIPTCDYLPEPEQHNTIANLASRSNPKPPRTCKLPESIPANCSGEIERPAAFIPPCHWMDGDQHTCDLFGNPDNDPTTQNCAYYHCSGRCITHGVANEIAGCNNEFPFDPTNDEHRDCSEFDYDEESCVLHGSGDPDKSNDSQNCLYFPCTGQCLPDGTSSLLIGCPGR